MTDTMRCMVWHGPGRVMLEPRPVPTLAPGQVLIEVRYNDLCSTDYPIVEGQVVCAGPGMALGQGPPC